MCHGSSNTQRKSVKMFHALRVRLLTSWSKKKYNSTFPSLIPQILRSMAHKSIVLFKLFYTFMFSGDETIFLS